VFSVSELHGHVQGEVRLAYPMLCRSSEPALLCILICPVVCGPALLCILICLRKHSCVYSHMPEEALLCILLCILISLRKHSCVHSCVYSYP
jgi:hypothetical protein